MRQSPRNDPLHPEGTELQAVTATSAADNNPALVDERLFIPTMSELISERDDDAIEKTEDADISDDSSSDTQEGW
jgi:hypothetical protein